MEKIRILIDKYDSFSIQVKASFWFLICSFMQKGISVITTPIFTRLLSTYEYGQYSIFSSWSAILTIFVTMRLSAGVYQQGLIKFDGERNVFSSSLQGLSLCLLLIWMIFYLLWYNYWNTIVMLNTTQMVVMLLTIWTTAIFEFWAAEQRVYYNYKALVTLTIAVSVAKPILGIFLVTRATDKVTARIIGLLTVEAIAYLGLFISQMKRGKVFYSSRFWKYALLYNIPLIPHYLSQTVLNNADRIMINNMVGEAEAGIYSLAYSVALIMTLFNTALNQTMAPWMYQKIKERKEENLASLAYISLVIVAIGNLFLIALAPEVVRIFAPVSYYEAIWVIPPVAISAFFMFSYDLFAKFAFYYERTRMIMLASIVGALLNILLNYIFIKIFGYIAAGYTTLACYMLYCIAHYILMTKVCDQFCDGVRPYNLKLLISFSGLFMMCGFLITATYQTTYVRYGVVVMMVIMLVVNKNKMKEAIQKFKIARNN